MTPKIKALVVEDDLEIQEEIKDALGVLGHEHDWAESQQDARDLIERNAYHYVLVDLDIPARTGRGFSKIEYGKKLVEQIQQVKGRGVIPVIIMTGHHKKGLNLTMELLGNGAMDFISKPFGDGTEGKSLPQVIQGVLEKHRKSFPPGVLPGDPPKEFKGGKLAFYADHVELEGEIILDRDCPGHGWAVVQALRTRRDNGKMPYLSAPKLAKAIDPRGRVSDGAINSCVHTLRAGITQTMLAKANTTVGRDGVIANGGKGYHLAEWLVNEEHDRDQAALEDCAVTAAAPPMPKNPARSAASPESVQLTERQHWVLDRLRDGVALTRTMVEEEFGIGEKQAKRELGVLSTRGLISFIRKPRPGYYILCTKSNTKKPSPTRRNDA